MKLKIEQIDINQFDYPLEEDRIAKYPLEQRDQSKLLLCKPNVEIHHKQFCDIIDEIPKNSLIVYNNTKVIHARVEFRKPTGARIEIFCLTPVEPVDYQLMFSVEASCKWICMVGNLKKWKEGKLSRQLTIGAKEITLSAEIISKDKQGNPIISFHWGDSHSFAEVLEEVGTIPIPPYLNRDTENIDSTRYQTVYSKYNGSVAAPTAGLHFTKEVFDGLKKKHIDFAELTLHVGAGTFQPVKADNALEHAMHGEQFIVSTQFLERLISQKDHIIATGTTSLRTLESIYWLGIKAMNNASVDKLEQWFWRENPSDVTKHNSLQALLNYLNREKKEFLVATTEIMIVPGYDFKVIDGIITNFHQPKSTLLLLISALIGDRWHEVYRYALKNDFRFLSYGDSSLLLR